MDLTGSPWWWLERLPKWLQNWRCRPESPVIGWTLMHGFVGLKGSDCEFHSRFLVKSSQVKGRIQVPSGCWILLYTVFHVFAQYDSCFTIFNMFHLTSPVPIVFILLSNYHLLSVDITPIGIVLIYPFLAEFSMLLKQRKREFTKYWSHLTLSLAKNITPETSRFANFKAKAHAPRAADLVLETLHAIPGAWGLVWCVGGGS